MIRFFFPHHTSTAIVYEPPLDTGTSTFTKQAALTGVGTKKNLTEREREGGDLDLDLDALRLLLKTSQKMNEK